MRKLFVYTVLVGVCAHIPVTAQKIHKIVLALSRVIHSDAFYSISLKNPPKNKQTTINNPRVNFAVHSGLPLKTTSRHLAPALSCPSPCCSEQWLSSSSRLLPRDRTHEQEALLFALINSEPMARGLNILVG